MSNPTNKSRRNFLQASALAATALIIPEAVLANKHGEGKDLVLPKNDTKSCLDYGKSFICNTGEYNSVRLWIESRTVITDTKSGKTTEYLQCGSCKSEDTFAVKNLFFSNNYDFLPIFGGDDVLVFRRHVDIRDSYRIIKPMTQMWGGKPDIRRIKPPVITELKTWEQMRDYTAAGIPIVTQTEITNEQTGLRAMIECPCKTMNISHVKKMYQVDNGPVALPDISKTYNPQISSLSLAFIAFNTPDFADFVIEAPTPIIQNGKEITRVHHYSELRTHQSVNRVLALGKLKS